MVRWPAGCLGIDPAEPKLGQIEAIDEDVDDANWIVLADPVFHAFRKQRALPTIRTINEALHPSPPQIVRESYRANHIKRSVFTQPGSEADISGRLAEVCCNLKNGHPQDVPRCPFRATKRHHAPSECQGHSNVASRYSW